MSVIESVTYVCKYNKYARSRASFHVLAPAVLPSGHSLQRVDVGPENVAYLFYFTRPMCNNQGDTIAVRPEEGIIEIVEGPLSSVSSAKSGSEYVEKQKTEFQTGGIPAKTFIFKNNGSMHAIGYEAAEATSLTTDQKTGSVVATTKFERHATLWVVDDEKGALCKVQARSGLQTLDDLAKIAESLKA